MAQGAAVVELTLSQRAYIEGLRDAQSPALPHVLKVLALSVATIRDMDSWNAERTGYEFTNRGLLVFDGSQATENASP